jgi:hypothetical protein
LGRRKHRRTPPSTATHGRVAYLTRHSCFVVRRFRWIGCRYNLYVYGVWTSVQMGVLFLHYPLLCLRSVNICLGLKHGPGSIFKCISLRTPGFEAYVGTGDSIGSNFHFSAL